MEKGQAIQQYEIGSMRNFVYLLVDWNSREAAMIDCQRDLTAPLADLKLHRLELTAILLTHTHHDHVAGLTELLAAFPQARLHAHEIDAHRLKPAERARLVVVQDEEVLQLGSTSIRVMHTPGHSAGECSYFIPSVPAIFTGDTLFIRDCGRTDFADGDNAQMFASLQRIKTLPPTTRILCGHHYAPECESTLERELRESPPLRAESVKALAELP
jgi:glyoxylase-like metal-dependent hydrolase (beta-lactamase superfamily II)